MRCAAVLDKRPGQERCAVNYVGLSVNPVMHAAASQLHNVPGPLRFAAATAVGHVGRRGSRTPYCRTPGSALGLLVLREAQVQPAVARIEPA